MKLRSLLEDKKGQLKLSDLAPVILTIVFAIVIAAVGGIILTELQEDQTDNSSADNITTSGISALVNTTDQLPLLGTVIGLVLVIGVVVGVFAFSGRGGGGI